MLIPVRFLSVHKFKSGTTGKEFSKFCAFGSDGTVYDLFLPDGMRLPDGIGLLDRFDIDAELSVRAEGGYKLAVNAISNYQPTKFKFD